MINNGKSPVLLGVHLESFQGKKKRFYFSPFSAPLSHFLNCCIFSSSFEEYRVIVVATYIKYKQWRQYPSPIILTLSLTDLALAVSSPKL